MNEKPESKMSSTECETFLLSLGVVCLDGFMQFFRWIILAADERYENIQKIEYDDKKGLLEIDRESARLVMKNILEYDEINRIPSGIIDGIEKDIYCIKSSFEKNGILVSFQIMNFNPKTPCAVFLAEEI